MFEVPVLLNEVLSIELFGLITLAFRDDSVRTTPMPVDVLGYVRTEFAVVPTEREPLLFTGSTFEAPLDPPFIVVYGLLALRLLYPPPPILEAETPKRFDELVFEPRLLASL